MPVLLASVSPKFSRSTHFLLLILMSFVFIACANVPDTVSSTKDSRDRSAQAATAHAVETDTPETTRKKSESLPVREPLHVIAVGDVMLGTDYPQNHLPPEEGKNLLSGVASILANADVTFGNYEGSLLVGGEPAKKCRDPEKCYLFRTPPNYVNNLVSAGFDVMSLANNHARDFGELGRSATMSALANAGILHSGMEGDIARWKVNGYQLALIAFAPFRGAHNPLDIERAALLVRELKLENDLVLISMHMGAEGADATRIPFTEEYFHGENRGDVVRFSHAMIDAGAALVLGHGPHVPRALELYEGHLIAYSLGNFSTYYGINVRGLNGLAPILSVMLSADGRLVSGQIISAEQLRPNGPTLDPRQRAARLIAELTTLDFPQTPLEISANGQIKVVTADEKRTNKLPAQIEPWSYY